MLVKRIYIKKNFEAQVGNTLHKFGRKPQMQERCNCGALNGNE